MNETASRHADRMAQALFALAAAVVLLTTPVTAGFVLRAFTCDLATAPGLWYLALFNYLHLAAYSVLFVLAWRAFRRQPLWLPIALTFAISAAVEVEQSVFNEGHCRLRDLLPNAVAVATGLAAVLAARALYRAMCPARG